jgi:predicted alpha/beta-hydrolase family hydrolase
VQIHTGSGVALADLSAPADPASKAAAIRPVTPASPASPASLATPASPASPASPALPVGPGFLLVLTHGAGGGADTPDLLAVRDAAVRLDGAVARVTQPYRARGARAPGSAVRQDAAWLEIISVLRARFPGIPLVQGGRSNGARVACRTACAADARAVLALAFPLHPPGRPDRSRAAELREAGTEVLVVNGDRDPFGVPGSADAATVVVMPGEAHALSRDPAAVGSVVQSWLRGILASP